MNNINSFKPFTQRLDFAVFMKEVLIHKIKTIWSMYLQNYELLSMGVLFYSRSHIGGKY